MKKLFAEAITTGVKAGFGIAYWFVFGMIILISWIGKGIGLAIVLSILFGLGYFACVKITKFFIKKGQKDFKRKNQHFAG